MNWIDIKDFKFDRTGEVILIMSNPKKKNEMVVREDCLSYSVYEKANWWTENALKGNVHIEEIDDKKIKYWTFSRASLKNVKAIVFKKDLLNDYLTNIENNG